MFYVIRGVYRSWNRRERAVLETVNIGTCRSYRAAKTRRSPRKKSLRAARFGAIHGPDCLQFNALICRRSGKTLMRLLHALSDRACRESRDSRGGGRLPRIQDVPITWSSTLNYNRHKYIASINSHMKIVGTNLLSLDSKSSSLVNLLYHS